MWSFYAVFLGFVYYFFIFLLLYDVAQKVQICLVFFSSTSFISSFAGDLPSAHSSFGT